ncbi:MAG TPA: class F sortase [Nakamurella sp.]
MQIPALGVDSSIVPIGVDDKGQLDIPADVRTVGWYRFGPAPGTAQGSAVLTGHVDDYLQGAGALANLGSLQPGDTVTVTDETGVPRTFSVLSREEWHKSEVPLDRLFDRGGDPRLVLITCGGPFNTSTLGYDDNIAVTAVPTGG